jgi:hypothetical protein
MTVMELLTFHDRIYGKINKKLYVFESSWDSFRPISGVGWNGSNFTQIDSEYKQDIFASDYGYGSLAERAECRRLTQETELSETKETKDPIVLWRWYGETNVKWWRDRPCVFSSPCVAKDILAWKKYLKYIESKSKTLRKPLKGRATRRLVAK